MAGPNSTPEPPTPRPFVGVTPGTPGRWSQAVLGGFLVLVLVLLAYRGYGSGLGVRPTDHQPSANRHRVDLNAAEKSELLQVPGIGPNLADAILTHRRDRGPFAAVDDLNAVKGVGGKTLDKLRPWVAVGEPPQPPAADEPAVERLERKSVSFRPPALSPPPPAAVRAAKVQPGEPPIDVNVADESDLQRLPGVGPVLAQKIVHARGLNRFSSPDDLRRVKGIGAKTLEAVRPYVVCR